MDNAAPAGAHHRATRGATAATAARSLAVAAIVLTACSGPTSVPEVRLPPVTGSFDYQLGGVDDTAGLTVVVRDATATPMAGAYNICYVNGFQSQPGDGEDWLQTRGSAVLRADDGTPVADPDWPDEYVLDPSTAAQRAVILETLRPVLSGCADKGFDAVEIDNFDSYTRFAEPATGHIDEAGAIELARSFASIAHERGLAIGQKNAAEATDIGRHEVGFDFAVAEECAAYRECDLYRGAYGPHVLQIEYSDNLPEPFQDVCASPDRAALTILRDRDLVTPDADGYVRQQCPGRDG